MEFLLDKLTYKTFFLHATNFKHKHEYNNNVQAISYINSILIKNI